MERRGVASVGRFLPENMSEKLEYFDETWSDWRYYRGGKLDVLGFLILLHTLKYVAFKA